MGGKEGGREGGRVSESEQEKKGWMCTGKNGEDLGRRKGPRKSGRSADFTLGVVGCIGGP